MLAKKVVELPTALISVNPNQPRKNFRMEDLLELRDSIEKYGVIQPIIVKKENDGGYKLIAGERRLRAAVLAGLQKIPAIVREADDEGIALIALIENIQREDLDYMEEARAYKNLIENFGLTQGDVARKVGKKQSTISNKLRILALPSEIQEALTANKLTERHARALLKLPDDKSRRQIIEKIIRHGFNVRQSEKLIEEYLSKLQMEKSERNKIRYISHKIYLNTLRKTFGEIYKAESGAKYFQEDKGQYYEVTITIPKEQSRGKKAVGE